jgi:WD repeat-containing protein 35
MLKRDGIIKAIKFVEDNTHPSLWRIIAEKALLDLDYLNAERAFLKVDDFKTLKYIKKIQTLDDREKQKAEILTLFTKYEEAEKIYRNI